MSAARGRIIRGGLKALPFSPRGRRPNRFAVELLEDLLRDARAGKVTGVAVAAMMSDGNSLIGVTGGPSLSLLGAADLVKAKLRETIEAQA